MNRHHTPTLLPAPRHVVWGEGQLQLPSELPLVLTAWQQELLPTALRFSEAIAAKLGIKVTLGASPAGLDGKVHIKLIMDDTDIQHDQGYSVTIADGAILLKARAAAGAAYGLATLQQIIISGGRRVPAVQVDDYPDFGRRGVMLDLSRGKIPTMESLYRFVDLLAALKINEFQLYTEHTFAYRQHREVWQNYSPMTGDEILLLDRYCQERFIDLVPNQNSFGHMKEWMVHERYHHLAETLTGWTFGGLFREGPFSFCPLEPAVLPFLSDLYDELLPHFSSQYFNVGCDETFDLGQGRSKEAVEQFGEHRVYLDLLLKIYEQVKARGKTMQFWGDIIIKAPESIAELPKDIVALEWGYEANHPFDEHCAAFAQAGIPFYVCPGTSTWNCLVGRTDNAIGNLRSAAENGRKHGAIGYLNTIWGDRGHQDYTPVSYLGIAFGAAVSWAVDANKEADVRPYLNRFVFDDQADRMGQVLYDLGNVYQAVGKTPSNGSVMGNLIHWAMERPSLTMGVSPEDFDRADQAIRAVSAGLSEVELACTDGALVLQELHNSVRMLLHACEFGKVRLALEAGGKPDPDMVRSLALDMDEIIAEHRRLWLARNRLGGLEEMSLPPLRRLRKLYSDLLS